MVKILVVDDSQDLVEFLEILLNMKGYEIETAYTADEVFDSLKSFSPDLILMDVELKKENGKELCRSIKEKTEYKNVPIILLSAKAELLKDYQDHCAEDAIEKPFNIDNVMEKINAVLRKNWEKKTA